MPDLPNDTQSDTSVQVRTVRTQYGDGLLGVPLTGLRLTWATAAAGDHEQVGYQVAVGAVGEATVPLAPVAGSNCIGVAVDVVFEPGERKDLVVRVATATGWSEWSQPLTVEAGVPGDLLAASVIGIDTEVEGPVALLRSEFELGEAPVFARLRLSALGLVDAWINGQSASDALFTPGWTSYQSRILLDTLDVTPLLHKGANVIVLAVGDGWFRGRMGFAGRTSIYGERSGAIAQIEVDGRVVAATDDSWLGGFGAVRTASIYDGTTTDLNLTPPGLHEPDFSPHGWVTATVIEVDKRLFEPRTAPPVRVVAELPMASDAQPGLTRLDAGQNIAGWVRLAVRGRAGDTVTVRHAEVLNPDGTLHTAALRSARATDTYFLDHDGDHLLAPVFTFHGFRYAEVAGAEVVDATAVAISSDLPPRSSFSCSSEALNQFHSNVFWSQRDNFVSVPTDCPQRDERLGWTGDAQAFAATAVTLMDSEAFWMSWLRDLEIDQSDAGGVPSVVPDIIRHHDMYMGGRPVDNMGRAGWADAATIVPFAVYESFGSEEVLARALHSMRRWVEHLRRRAGEEVLLPTEPFQYGDWLDPDAPGDRPWQAKVSSDFVANAFYARSAQLLARAERLVGDPRRGDGYDELAARVAAATWNRWGEEAAATQSGAAIALEFGIAPIARRAEVARGLAESVRRQRGRIATGFLGTPLVLFALSHHGYFDEAYLMLLRREAPSWLYQVDHGATTVWERWDAILPDGRIHSGAMDAGEKQGEGSMLSFNHYAYGAVIDWVYRNVAGIAPDLDEPGYRTIRVAPRPAVGLDHASASIQTRLGMAAVQWRVEGDRFEATVTVPNGARAMLDLPLTPRSTVVINGQEAPTELLHGVHRVVVTHPAVSHPARL